MLVQVEYSTDTLCWCRGLSGSILYNKSESLVSHVMVDKRTKVLAIESDGDLQVRFFMS